MIRTAKHMDNVKWNANIDKGIRGHVLPANQIKR